MWHSGWLCKLFDKALVETLALWGFGNVLANMIGIIYSLSVRSQSFRLVSTPFLSRAFAYRADNRIFLATFLPTLSILLLRFL
jgi:hypothetical protein